MTSIMKRGPLTSAGRVAAIACIVLCALYFLKDDVASYLNVPVAFVHGVAMAGAILAAGVVLSRWGMNDK